MKNITRLGLAMVTTLGLLASFNTAMASEKGNWTETFQLKGNNWITHTPNFVNFDGMMQGRSINISARSFNGTPLAPCGLHVQTDSTREEFVAALQCSGMY